MAIIDILKIISCITGSISIFFGVDMVYKGITAQGVINIKSVLVSGKVDSGSAGILFAFIGFALILLPILKKKTISEKATMEKEKRFKIDWEHSESGDPYVDLYLSVFSEEEFPPDSKEVPICDWANEERIKNVIKSHISNYVCSAIGSYIDFYFNKKKRIFAGWDKYPVCFPPVHKELEQWILNAEKEIRGKLPKVDEMTKSILA